MAKMSEKKQIPAPLRSCASILAIGTANPANCFFQNQYPDFYFRVTNSHHMTDLKAKFQRICDRSGVKKRHYYLTEEILKANPNICKYKATSLDARQELMKDQIPQLGKEAALKAIQEWGQPISRISHLIVCTTSSNHMPGADYQLAKLLGLSPTVQRFMLYQQGCYVAGSAMRLAKDVAENNSAARILIVAVDITGLTFCAPSETQLDILVAQAIFGDGAAATIIGADPDAAAESPLFRILWASQSAIPDTEDGVSGFLSEMGLSYHLSPKNPKYIGDHIEKCLLDACPREINDYNSLFYVLHPGGRAILDEIERKLGLNEEKLEASRRVLSEYGNMRGPTVLFVLDEMRKMSTEEGKATTGGGLDWGFLAAFGPGITVETLVLQSVPLV